MFKAEKHFFSLAGQPFFLYSGEIQYFRLKQELWLTHLEQLKAAGCNTVTTYVPWSWHEWEKGQFDFTGATLPERDLVHFLDCARQVGLYVAVKPGPYILAEFEDRGIPAWLTQGYPAIQAKSVDMITYMHPAFQTFVKKWYDAVLPIIAKNQITQGGQIIMLQVCNEVGLYNWLDGAGDTSEVSMTYFRRYLQHNYKSIEQLNQDYQAQYSDFNQVGAPTKPAACPTDYIHWVDWHQFHRWYYAEYLSWLIQEIKQRKINIQLYHNIPGWVFGRGQEYPVNISFYSEIVKRHRELIFGVDHIPENPNYRNQHDDLIINEMTRALQGGQMPMWAAEQQAGTREHQVHTFPNEMELFYKACIGRGMTGMNFYMFSQGINPERRGTFGPTFYWMNALGHDGTPKALYPIIKKIGHLIQTFGRAWMQTERQASAAMAFYPPYYHDEFFYPLFGGQSNLNATKVGLRYDPKIMRNQYYFEGMLKVLTIQNRDFNMINIQDNEIDAQQYPQCWVMALDCMDATTQQRLVNYVRHGGHLIIWPGCPDKDLKLQPCTILKDFLRIEEMETIDFGFVSKIDIGDQKDINAYPLVRTFEPEGAEVIATLPDGKVCGVRKKIDSGLVTLIGTIITYNIKEHLLVFDHLFNKSTPNRHLQISNPALQAHIRYGKDYAMLCLLNYTPIRQTTTVTLAGFKTGEQVCLPDQGELAIEAHQGLLIPINYSIHEHIKIIWATCEVLSYQVKQEHLSIVIEAHPELASKIMLQTGVTICKAAINNQELTIKQLPGKHYLISIPPRMQSIEVIITFHDELRSLA